MADGEHVSNELSGSVTGNVVQAGSIGSVTLVTPPPPPRTPWQVPGQSPGFVDREVEVNRVLALLDGAADPSSSAMILLSGPPGVGKSELGHRIAALTRDRFPDGQVYVPCSKYRAQGGAIDLGEVYRSILSTTGTAEEAIPASTEDRGAAYRSYTHGRRMLVVLDDADLELHVRALAPGGTGAVVVTSQRRLESLRGGRVLALSVEPLTAQAGADLIAEHLGRERAQAEPGQVAALVELCGGLPVALRAICATLSRRPSRLLSETVAQLRDSASRAARLEHSGVFTVFDEAYQSLPQSAARLYRLLGLMPGTDTTATALAAVAGLPDDDDLEYAIDELLASSLLDEDSANRLSAHSLVRLHAAHLAERVHSEAERTDLARRIVLWHLRSGQAADLAIAPIRMRLPGDAALNELTPDIPHFADDATALAWLEAQHAALTDCVRIAVDRGWNAAAWLLCDPLWALYQNHKHYADWVVSFRFAIIAAERAGADWVRTRLLCLLGRAHFEQREFDEAFACLATALESARAGEDRLLETSVLEFTGIAHHEAGNPDTALELFAAGLQVLTACADSPDVRRAGLILRYRSGLALNLAGRPHEAVTALEDIREQADRSDPRLAGRVRIALAEALLRTGDSAQARDLALHSAQEAGRRNVPSDQARALDLLADCDSADGNEDQAQQYRQAAQEIRHGLQGSRSTGSQGS